MFRYYLLGGDTEAPSGLYARLCHAFLVFLCLYAYCVVAAFSANKDAYEMRPASMHHAQPAALTRSQTSPIGRGNRGTGNQWSVFTGTGSRCALGHVTRFIA